MPRTTREWALRELKAAAKNIDWAGSHMAAVIEEYQSDHPEISEPLRKLCELQIMVQEGILKVRSTI